MQAENRPDYGPDAILKNIGLNTSSFGHGPIQHQVSLGQLLAAAHPRNDRFSQHRSSRRPGARAETGSQV